MDKRDLSGDKTLKIGKQSFDEYKTTNLLEEYVFGKSLGKELFKKVRKVTHKATGQERIIKIFKKNISKKEKLVLEVNILSKLSHPNIMHIFDFFEDKANFYMVAELCKGTELLQMIIKKGNFSESEAYSVMNQLMSAICYCHQNKIVHRDLKLGNIIIEEKNKGNSLIKIIGWGGATYFSNNEKMTKVKGSPYYIAPEVLNGEYDEKCDIWSLGVILYILLCGYPPFNGESYQDVIESIKKGEFNFPEQEWSVITEEAKDLIRKMLAYPPKDRLNSSQVLLHPWMNHFKNKNDENKSLSKTYLENMKNFKRNKQFEQEIISFIISQLITKEECGELLAQFKEWDKNNDGVLNKEEILECYKSVYGIVDQEEITKIINNVDLDGNGVIDYNEFLNCTLKKDNIITQKNLEIAFKDFDKDGNGVISIDEILLVLKKTNNREQEDFKKLIKEADINEDGKIDFFEFKNTMEKFFS